MKPSKKMLSTIKSIEKQYGTLNRDYFIEPRVENRVGNGFFDGCLLTSNLSSIQNIHIVVAHDGSHYSL